MPTRQLQSSDGHFFDVYEVLPEGKTKGGIVVLQEIFGVNPHIKEVVDGYARDGYAASAPALFDREEPNVELGYEDEADFNKGLSLAFEKLQISDALRDIQATVNSLASHGNVGVVGFCFGGLLTWLSACELENISAVSSYYGGGIVNELNRSAKCPTIMHFGEKDEHIPMGEVEKIKESLTDVKVHVYQADHGFNCNHRGSFDESSAKLAKQRTLEFFSTNL